MYLKNDTVDNLTYEYDGIEEIKYNTEEGSKLGTIKVYDNDTLLYESDVYLNTNIEYYNFYLIGIIVVIFLFIIVSFWKIKRRKRHRRRKR